MTLPADLGTLGARGALVGGSRPMARVRDEIARLALETTPVLVRGERGTGKRLAARVIHDAGPRSSGPFVRIDVRDGVDSDVLAEAQGGTIVFEEVSHAAAAVQERFVALVFAARSADARVLATTRRDLERMVRDRTFAPSALGALAVETLWMPPLRARRRDVPDLARSLSNGVEFDEEALGLLCSHAWPGNVRELRRIIERLGTPFSRRTVRAAEILRELPARASAGSAITTGGVG